MARRRSKMPATEATTEGARQLRVLLARSTFGAIAKRLRCDEGTVRHYAREKRKPESDMRDRIFAVLGIPWAAWDELPSKDVYIAGEDPATTRRS